MKFKVLKKDIHARYHYVIYKKNIETPLFMPVGTYLTVKSLSPEEIKNTGSKIIFS